MVDYFSPASVEEALGLLAAHPQRAMIIAGGTDLLPDLRKGKKQPQVLVNITCIPGLDQIWIEAGYIMVGAAVTFSVIKDHPMFRRQVHALAEAACSVGAPGIQSAATWVGNLVQAMPAADGAVIALALEAEALVVSQNQAIWQPVEKLFLSPGRSAIDSSCQIITRLRFPIPDGTWGTAWQRIGRRTALTLPILNCAVKLVLDDGRILRAVVALGPVAPRPFRAKATETFLISKPPTPEVFAEAGRLAQSESDPRNNVLRASREYRLAVIPVLIRRALTSASMRANGLEDTKISYQEID
jgi:carbon-monoxide dehydrogenase medium subunit